MVLSPAIGSRKNKVGAVNVFLPTISLFVIGMAFSYIIVIPFTLTFLYNYGEAIGVETFFNINSFVSFVFQFLLGFGVAFELPVIMYAISLTGIVDNNLRIINGGLDIVNERLRMYTELIENAIRFNMNAMRMARNNLAQPKLDNKE
jgi:hypothetical protein